MESAAGRRVNGVGICDAEVGLRQAQPRLRRQDRVQQGLGVRMARVLEEIFGCRLLNDSAQIHDRHPRCQMLDHGQIVGDQDISQAKLFP